MLCRRCGRIEHGRRIQGARVADQGKVARDDPHQQLVRVAHTQIAGGVSAKLRVAAALRGNEAEGDELAVGYPNRYEGWEVQGVIASFSARHPYVEIDVVSGSHDDLYQTLLAEKIDVAFNDQGRALSDEFANEFLVRA